MCDMRPTEEALVIKAKNRKWRTLKKEQERLQDSDTLNFSCSYYLSKSISKTASLLSAD